MLLIGRSAFLVAHPAANLPTPEATDLGVYVVSLGHARMPDFQELGTDGRAQMGLLGRDS
jgi:hypothetical protein